MKKGYFNPKNLGKRRICRLNTVFIDEILHTNHIQPRRFKGVFRYRNMDRKNPTRAR